MLRVGVAFKLAASALLPSNAIPMQSLLCSNRNFRYSFPSALEKIAIRASVVKLLPFSALCGRFFAPYQANALVKFWLAESCLLNFSSYALQVAQIYALQQGFLDRSSPETLQQDMANVLTKLWQQHPDALERIKRTRCFGPMAETALKAALSDVCAVQNQVVT